MGGLADKIKNKTVFKSCAIFFLGQAGFIIKDKKGLLYSVDVYFSDCCEREFGFKRLIPKLLMPDEIVFDYILTTHDHYDHFDIDAMPVLMSNSHTKLVTTQTGALLAKKIGIKERITVVNRNDEIKIGNIMLKVVYCDHGELSTDAVGFIFETEGKKIYLVGDSAYHREMAIDKEDVDLLFVPINGAFGNMNEKEAAEFTELISPQTVVPCHYGLFSEHGGNVDKFQTEIKTAGNTRIQIMSIGDCIDL